MQSLKFKQLLVISNSTKSANLFDFQKDLTIITADDNNYGKSTLGKLLYWSLGCDPDFDTKWSNLDCRSILRFTIGDVDYETMRYKGYICLKEDGKITFFPKITGDYSNSIGKLLGFHALLPKRDTDLLETPPPAFYFVPFYIDQKKSWATAWENFSNLGQYQNWKSTIIKYHVGLLPKEHFELELQKSLKKQDKARLDLEIGKLDTTLEVVGQFISKAAATIDQKKLEKMTVEIREDLLKLSENQEGALDELARFEADRAFLEHQKVISEHIISDLVKDYTFAVENLLEDEIECPLCGTHHENSVVNRASILTDRQQAEAQLEQIDRSLSDITIKLEKARSKIEQTRKDIDTIHAKYVVENDEVKIGFNEIIENIAGNSIQENVRSLQAEKTQLLSTVTSDIKQITKSQNELLTDEQKDEIYSLFISTFTNYIELLGAEDINTSSITTPMDYSKIIKEGGAAEGSRGILAYYMTIHTMIEKSGNDVIAPMLIDTPNQQEQSLGNYDKILELIKKKVSSKTQIILCALQNEKLEILEENANIINLDENMLLKAGEFEVVKREFDAYKLDELIKNSELHSDD